MGQLDTKVGSDSPLTPVVGLGTLLGKKLTVCLEVTEGISARMSGGGRWRAPQFSPYLSVLQIEETQTADIL